MDEVTPNTSVSSVSRPSKDQRYRAKHLAEIREKDRLRAAKRRRNAKAKQSVLPTRSASPVVAEQIPQSRATLDDEPTTGSHFSALPIAASPLSAEQSQERQTPPDRAPSGRSRIVVSKNYEPADHVLTEVREIVWAWTNDEGPITGWPERIRSDLREAKSTGTTRIVAQDWRGHANVGKVLLKDLNSFTSSLWPKDEEKLRDMVRQAFELLQTLQGGITAIETTLTFFGRNS